VAIDTANATDDATFDSARSDQLIIAPHQRLSARGQRLFVEHLFGDLSVLAVDIAPAGLGEAAARGVDEGALDARAVAFGALDLLGARSACTFGFAFAVLGAAAFAVALALAGTAATMSVSMLIMFIGAAALVSLSNFNCLLYLSLTDLAVFSTQPFLIIRSCIRLHQVVLGFTGRLWSILPPVFQNRSLQLVLMLSGLSSHELMVHLATEWQEFIICRSLVLVNRRLKNLPSAVMVLMYHP